MHQQQYDEAESYLQEALTKAPSDPDSLANLIVASQVGPILMLPATLSSHFLPIHNLIVASQVGPILMLPATRDLDLFSAAESTTYAEPQSAHGVICYAVSYPLIVHALTPSTVVAPQHLQRAPEVVAR